jgi:chromate reductase
MSAYKILAISGSLRKGSYNSSLIQAFKEDAPEGVTIEIVEIGDIPTFNQDLEANFPQVVIDLKQNILAADGVLIATPEYNRGVPGMLKNVIDWTSRPYGDSSWNQKPVYVVGASVAPTGAALAQYQLKQTMLFLNTFVLGQPEFYCGTANTKFDEEGKLIDEDTKAAIGRGLSAFTALIDRIR